MRGFVLGIALLGLASPASAGVYNSLEGHPYLAPEQIRAYILRLRGIAAEPPKGKMGPASPRAQYLAQVAALEKEKANGLFSMQNRVDLGACYLRLGKPHEAIRVLSQGDQDHFLIQANLASACFLTGDLEVAIHHQERALRAWPVVWASWTESQRQHLHLCEKAFLRLLMSRLDEGRRGRMDRIDLDPIFKGLNRVVPSKTSDYKPGPLPQDVLEQLQPNAYGITLQLVAWYPADDRLFWLMAELLNAVGAVGPAFEIMDGMWNSASARAFNGLIAHRKVLVPVTRLLKDIQKLNQEGTPPAEYLLTLFAAMPRGGLDPPGVGAIASQAAATLPLEIARLRSRPPVLPTPPEGPDPGGMAEQVQDLPFNWRHVTIGFAFGFLVAILLGFQWQEWKRQWALRQAADPIPVDSPEQSAQAQAHESETGVKPGAP